MTANRLELIGVSVLVLTLTATVSLAQNTSNPLLSGNTVNPVMSGNTVTQGREAPCHQTVQAIRRQRCRQQKNARANGVADHERDTHPKAEKLRRLGKLGSGHRLDPILA